MRRGIASRKLWVAVLGSICAVALPALGVVVPPAALAIVLGYLGAEGLADAVGAARKPKDGS